LEKEADETYSWTGKKRRLTSDGGSAKKLSRPKNGSVLYKNHPKKIENPLHLSHQGVKRKKEVIWGRPHREEPAVTGKDRRVEIERTESLCT